eukprot:TRINITY_DN11267_c0_g1_i1.p1 TRINITY_DN11267_c0_g1~~TRINITY_DN11267_c0_g1_i1.p1  ORF type:complete len:555 (+),score=87.30 TRINITY_DN11267_c0_g1_i1:87-1667(+)
MADSDSDSVLPRLGSPVACSDAAGGCAGDSDADPLRSVADLRSILQQLRGPDARGACADEGSRPARGSRHLDTDDWDTSDGESQVAQCTHVLERPSRLFWTGGQWVRLAAPHDPDPRYVGIADMKLYVRDAIRVLESQWQRLADKGRRGRSVKELSEVPLEIERITIKRKKSRVTGGFDCPNRRLFVCFKLKSTLRPSTRKQLAFAFREAVGPLRQHLGFIVVAGQSDSETGPVAFTQCRRKVPIFQKEEEEEEAGSQSPKMKKKKKKKKKGAAATSASGDTTPTPGRESEEAPAAGAAPSQHAYTARAQETGGSEPPAPDTGPPTQGPPQLLPGCFEKPLSTAPAGASQRPSRLQKGGTTVIAPARDPSPPPPPQQTGAETALLRKDGGRQGAGPAPEQLRSTSFARGKGNEDDQPAHPKRGIPQLPLPPPPCVTAAFSDAALAREGAVDQAMLAALMAGDCWVTTGGTGMALQPSPELRQLPATNPYQPMLLHHTGYDWTQQYLHSNLQLLAALPVLTALGPSG